jgi:predicted RNase H-like nuclease (RuvC/YqgF family)
VATGGGNITFASSNGNAIIDTAQAAANPEIEEVSHEYVEKLKVLTETLENVEKQLARLTTDSEEMTNLNRTLTGINTVYELQLKGVSQQVGSIEQINEQTRRMAQQIEELNGMYARMIQALTINMKNASNQVGI